MSGGFVKLYGTILDSSIWAEDMATRLVWLTLMTMADKDGIVQASHGGLARRANVPRDACESALRILSSPDPDDRSGVDEGRRIRTIQGGWSLINYSRYREMQTARQVADAEKKRRKYRRNHGELGPDEGETSGEDGETSPGDVRETSPTDGETSPSEGEISPTSPLDAKAKADAERSKASSSSRARDPDLSTSVPEADAPTELPLPVVLTIAANKGMADNPAIGDAFNPIIGTSGASSSLANLVTNQHIDPIWAERAVYTMAKRYKPDDPGRQITTMGYFAQGLTEGWKKKVAKDQAATGKTPDELPRVPNGRQAADEERLRKTRENAGKGWDLVHGQQPPDDATDTPRKLS